jgi:methylmalonyl-CoA/ethylmalonyl-CoA epimerase
MSLKGGESALHPVLPASTGARATRGPNRLHDDPGVFIGAAHYISARGRKVRCDSARDVLEEKGAQPLDFKLKIKKIDHVAVCVADIDDASARWSTLLGVAPVEREWVESQKTEVVAFPLGDASIELVTPRGNEGLARFLEKRGPGLHHVAVEVEGIDDAIALLKALGVPMIDSAARIGARGHKVAFVHPKATGGVLVELVETSASLT